MSNHNQAKQGVQNRDINAVQRVSLALRLRSQRVKWEDIAKACGYTNPGTAYRAVMKELERCVEKDVQNLRREEAESLDRLEFECWKRLQDKDYAKSMLFAVDRIVAIKERRARMFGLDIPVDSALNVSMPVIREIPSNYLGLEPLKSVEATKE